MLVGVFNMRVGGHGGALQGDLVMAPAAVTEVLSPTGGDINRSAPCTTIEAPGKTTHILVRLVDRSRADKQLGSIGGAPEQRLRRNGPRDHAVADPRRPD